MTVSLDSVKTVVGILLGLFGTVYTFLGITTGEVTSILRNDPGQAPLVPLLLLLGLLAAVLTVVIDDKPNVASPLDLAAVIVLLLGVGTVFIWAIPVQPSKQLSWIWGGPKWGWIWGTVVCGIAIAALLRHIKDVGEPTLLDEHGNPRPPKHRIVSLKVLLIVVGVMLIAMSVDVGLRLEQQSQLHTTVQVSATAADSDSDSDPETTLTVHLTAAKVPNDSAVRFEVSEVDSADPSKFLRDVASGDIDPDVNGDVDNTLEIPLPPGISGSINIVTETCHVSQPPAPKASTSSRPAAPPKPPKPAINAPPTAVTLGNAASATATPTKPPAGKPTSASTTRAGAPAVKASPTITPAGVKFTDCMTTSQLTMADPVLSPTATATLTGTSAPSATPSPTRM